MTLVRFSNDSTLPVEQRRNYKGVVDAFTRIASEEGMSTFWRGCGPFVQRAMLVGIVQATSFTDMHVLGLISYHHACG